MATTGNFTSLQLLQHESDCTLEALSYETAIAIGQRATEIALQRKLPIIIEVMFDGRTVYKSALEGSKVESENWILRKSRVVHLKHHSTLYERVTAEEEGRDWHKENGVEDETHAIHGGGFPLISRSNGFEGILLISGLPQVEDHLFAVDVLTSFIDK
jgi:uncharacterized protein (UPF0303 family)